MTYDHSSLNTRDAISARRDDLLTEARTLADAGDLTGDDLDRFEALTAEIEALNKRHGQFAALEAAGPGESGDGARQGPSLLRRGDPWQNVERAHHDHDVRERALTAIEATEVGHDAAREAASGLVRDNGADVARWALVTSQPAYGRVFSKYLTDPVRGHVEFTDDEAHAWRVMKDYQRAMSEGSAAAGEAMVPTHLDPTVLLHSDGSVNPFRRISRVVTIANANQWNGITSAGVNAAYATEGAEVTDGSPLLTPPAVPVYRFHSFVAASFELAGDVRDLAREVGLMFRDAKDQLEADKFVTGSGTGEPTGITTALDAATGNIVYHATNSTFTAADIYAAQVAVPPRFRDGAQWVMPLENIHRVRQLDTNGVLGMSVGDFTQGSPANLLGWGLNEGSALATNLSTTTNYSIVVGNFGKCHTIVDRVGAEISFIPHVFGESYLPTGQVGWYLFGRNGADVTCTNGLVVSANPGA